MLQRVDKLLEVLLIAAASLAAEAAHVGTGAEVAHGTAQQDGAAAVRDGAVVRGEQFIQECLINQIVRWLCHGDDADGAILLIGDDGHGPAPLRSFWSSECN